jgi:propanol-preferring alcohol dehydrogenase
MKAAVLRNFKSKLSLEMFPIPKPRENELLVRIHACGVCHTDVHVIDGDWAKQPTCSIPGHEGCGVVVEVGGTDKANSPFSIGDRVGIPWLASSCLNCEYCLTGWESLCAHQVNTGYSVNGCLAEYAIARIPGCVSLPSEISFQQAAREFSI